MPPCDRRNSRPIGRGRLFLFVVMENQDDKSCQLYHDMYELGVYDSTYRNVCQFMIFLISANKVLQISHKKAANPPDRAGGTGGDRENWTER